MCEGPAAGDVAPGTLSSISSIKTKENSIVPLRHDLFSFIGEDNCQSRFLCAAASRNRWAESLSLCLSVSGSTWVQSAAAVGAGAAGADHMTSCDTARTAAGRAAVRESSTSHFVLDFVTSQGARLPELPVSGPHLLNSEASHKVRDAILQTEETSEWI